MGQPGCIFTSWKAHWIGKAWEDLVDARLSEALLTHKLLHYRSLMRSDQGQVVNVLCELRTNLKVLPR